MMLQHDASRPDLDSQSTNDSTEELNGERRRPGRRNSVNPALIPLLRGALKLDAGQSDDASLTKVGKTWPRQSGLRSALFWPCRYGPSSAS